MSKKVIFTAVIHCVLLLGSCSSSNKYGLAYTSDGSERVEYIYYTDEMVVYVVGGMMMAEIEGEPKMLEMALKDGDITIQDLLDSAENDLKNKDIEATEYPDGSIEYHYDNFDMIKLNTLRGSNDIYFVPSSMGYNDVTNS